MTDTPTTTKIQENRSAKKKQQSFPKTDIGSPKVPIRKKQTKQQYELLSDWEHSS